MVTPYVASYYSHTNGRSERRSNLGERIATIPTENRHALIAPVLTAAQQGGSVRRVDAPHHTITASNKDQNSDIVPRLVGCGGRAGQSRPRGGDEPTGTITAKADGCVAVAFLAQNNYLEPGHDAREPLSTIVGRVSTQSPIVAFIAQHNGDSRPDGSEAARPGRDSGEPLATMTQSGSQQSLVSAFVARQFGNSTGHADDEPTATVMAGGDGKSQLVTPYLQAYYGTGDGQVESEPMRTVTTKNRHRHVEATISAPPLTEAQAERALQVAEFMRVSLRNVPVYGLRRAYVKLKRGEYENINKAFIPLPAELAAMANAECRLIREDRIRKQERLRAIEDSVSRTLPSSHGLMDLRVTQRERAIELAEKGFVRVAEGVDHLEFAHLAKSRELPAGSRHLWSPIAVRINRSRIQTKLNVQPPPVSPERAAELARMLALPDVSQVTAEQMAYRGEVKADIEAAEPVDQERAA
ncbi:hypothetical protein FB008_11551 [Sinorhizobium medicae]|nr:hypothetical protein FB008_11551 [Sinorhizobium medicae]